MNETTKFDIEVQLTGQDGNAFSIMGAVVRGMKKAGATPVEVAEFQKEAMSGDYENLLSTAQKWVVVL